jgi:hypothetical protein
MKTQKTAQRIQNQTNTKPHLQVPQHLPEFLDRDKSQIPSLHSLEQNIYKNFKLSYLIDPDSFYIKIINEIICNETSHVVAEFKDYLIYGDLSEFVQNSYTLEESFDILPKIYEYYDSCSVIFPNYILLPESKYLYKNIQRKQRVIDNQQEIEQEQEINHKKKDHKLQLNLSESTTLVFNSLALESLLNLTETSTIRKMMGLSSLRNKPTSLEEKISLGNDSTSNNNSQSVLNLVNVLTKMETFQNKKIPKTNCTLRKSNKTTIGISKHPTNQATINIKGNNPMHSNSSNISQSKSVKRKNINNHSTSSPKKRSLLVNKGRNYKRAIYTSDISGINKMNSTSEKEHKKLYYNTNQVNYKGKPTKNVCTKINHINSSQKKQQIDTYTQQDNRTIIPNSNQSKHSKHNSHQIKKGLITMLLSSNTETFKKNFKDKKLKIHSTIQTNYHCPIAASPALPNKPYCLHEMKTTNKTNNLHNRISIPSKPQQLTNNNNNNVKSARPSSQTKSSLSMAKLTNKILGFILKINPPHPKQNDKKIIVNNNITNVHNNGVLKTETQNINNVNKALYPLTSREEQKLKFNKKPSNNNFTTISSSSISHKKTFTSSSLGTATVSLNNNNFQQVNEDKTKDSNGIGNIQSPISHIPKSSFKPISHRNERTNQVNLRLSNDMFIKPTLNHKSLMTQANVNFTIKSHNNQFLDNPNNKILKTYSHFQSNSTLVGSKNKNYKLKKNNNEIIPLNKQNGNSQTPSGVKGIKIKGFDEILEQSKNSLIMNSGVKGNTGYNKTNSDRNEKKLTITTGNNANNTIGNCRKKIYYNNNSKPKTNRSIHFKK